MKILKRIPSVFFILAFLGGPSDLHADGLGALQDTDGTIHHYIQAAKEDRAKQWDKAREERDAAPVTIVIYQTSDVHGSIDFYKGNPAKNIPPSGGAASLATLFKDRKPDLYLDSGDWFSGSMVGDLTKGDAVFAVFEALHLDATVVGNHDYDLGEANLARLVSQASGHFAVLGSNVGGTPGLLPYIIKEVKGVKIGIFGVLTTEMANGLATPNNVANSSFADEATAAQKMVDALRGQGAQIVIALTHLGVEKYGTFSASNIKVGDIYLANHVHGIDLILGGHTHVSMDPPITIDNGSQRTVIFEPGAHLAGAYRIVLSVNARTGEIRSMDAHLIALNPAIYAPDPAIQKIVDDYARPMKAEADKPIGSAAVALTQNSTDEGLIYNWATDAFRRYGHTDLGLINTFGIRGGLPQGALAYADLYGMMSFPNQMTAITLTGKELWKTAECSLPRVPGDAIQLRFSKEVRVAYNPNTTADQQNQLKQLCDAHSASAPIVIHVVSLKVNGTDVSPDDTQSYTVETMDYVAISELKLKRGVNIQNVKVSSKLARDMMEDEIRSASPIAAQLDGRVQAVP